MILSHRSWGNASNPAAVLVHGAGDSSTTWADVGPWLASQGWHALAVDIRGHGDTPADPAVPDPSFQTLADDLLETMAQLRPGQRRVDLLVGASLGALIGLVCVVEHPLFARRLVLLDPPGAASVDPTRLAAEPPRMFADPPKFVREFYEGATEPLTQAAIDRVVGSIAATDPTAFTAAMVRVAHADLVSLAERCTVPSLVFLGRDKHGASHDHTTLAADRRDYSMLVADERQRFCTAFRRAQVRLLDTGHDIHRAAFAEFIESLSQWLTGRHAST